MLNEGVLKITLTGDSREVECRATFDNLGRLLFLGGALEVLAPTDEERLRLLREYIKCIEDGLIVSKKKTLLDLGPIRALAEQAEEKAGNKNPKQEE